MLSPAHELSNRKWIALASHRTWLLGQAEKLFSFFERGIIIPLGGFYDLDDEGRQTPPGYGAADKPARYLFAASRIIHAYAITYLMGRSGADIVVAHGINFLVEWPLRLRVRRLLLGCRL
jgi:mannose/cellobiose epimerase-like protein (N-acyl-D-glucosamine 2-epimerase family)